MNRSLYTSCRKLLVYNKTRLKLHTMIQWKLDYQIFYDILLCHLCYSSFAMAALLWQLFYRNWPNEVQQVTTKVWNNIYNLLAESWKCDFIKVLAILFCFHGESYLLPLLYWWLACPLLLYFHHDCHYTFLRVKRLLLCGLTTLLPIVQYYRQSLGHIYHNHLRLTIPRK